MRRLITKPRRNTTTTTTLLYKPCFVTLRALRVFVINRCRLVLMIGLAIGVTVAGQSQSRAPRNAAEFDELFQRIKNWGRWGQDDQLGDRKSTRLNSSHGYISYAVFCLKKKKRNF